MKSPPSSEQTPTRSAVVEHEFAKGFVLNEESMRKIASIAHQGGIGSIVFEVTRSDSTRYSTSRIDDVLEDENSKSQRITKLEIRSSTDSPICLRICFSKDAVELNATGEDRNTVFVLSSDLKNYIEQDVCARQIRISPSKLASAIPLLLSASLMVPLILVAFSVRNDAGSKPIKDLLAQDPAVDSDVLLREYVHFSVSRIDRVYSDSLLSYFPIWMISVIIILVLGLPAISWVLYKLYPTSVFCWGKAKADYEQAVSLRAKIFWGIGIAFVVSLAAGLVIALAG